jgi:hypothetical protein
MPWVTAQPMSARYNRFISICLSMIMLTVCAGLLFIGAICEFLGVANVLNGGRYLHGELPLELIIIGAILLTFGFFLGRAGHRKLNCR